MRFTAPKGNNGYIGKVGTGCYEMKSAGPFREE